MRFLADENFPGPAITILRKQGHDVLSAKESMAGRSDPEILRRAQMESRVLLTMDKDFGELAFRWGLPAECGVVLFRLSGESPELDKTRVLAALELRTDWAGHFAVVSDDRIRLRPLSRKPQ